MSEEKITQFIANKGNFFGTNNLQLVKSILSGLDDNKSDILFSTEFKDPTVILICAIFGISNFLLGKALINVLQYILCFAVVGGIWLIIDLINAKKRTFDYNLELLRKV